MALFVEAAFRLCSCVSCRTWPCLAAFFRSDYLWQSAGCWPRYVPDKEKDEDGKTARTIWILLAPLSFCTRFVWLLQTFGVWSIWRNPSFCGEICKLGLVCFASVFSSLHSVDAVQLAGGNVSEGIFVGAFMSMSSTAVVSCPRLSSSLTRAQTPLIERPRQTVCQPSASVRLQGKL
jgi:hypothetical protein